MSRQKHDPEWYLKDPRIRRWMARCSSCDTVGIRPGAPPRFHGSDQYKELFEAPVLDEKGTCPVCRDVGDKAG
jgi:hypothetical protein